MAPSWVECANKTKKIKHCILEYSLQNHVICIYIRNPTDIELWINKLVLSGSEYNAKNVGDCYDYRCAWHWWIENQLRTVSRHFEKSTIWYYWNRVWDHQTSSLAWSANGFSGRTNIFRNARKPNYIWASSPLFSFFYQFDQLLTYRAHVGLPTWYYSRMNLNFKLKVIPDLCLFKKWR